MSKEVSEKIVTAWTLLRTALPIGAFYLTEILVGITDLAVVGSLGTEPLAAVGLGKTILLSIMVVGFATLSVGAVFMAERSEKSFCGRIILASVIVAVPMAVFAIAAARITAPILNLGGYTSDFVSLFSAYSHVLAWAIPPALLFSSLKNLLNAHSRTGIILWLSIGIVTGNLVLSIILVHGFGAWAGLGVAGAAWATVFINVTAALALLIYALRKQFLGFTGQNIRCVLSSARDITGLGWAAGAQQALESVLFIAVLLLLGMHSSNWLAAGTVVFAVMELNYAASGAIGEVLSARIAKAKSTGGDLRSLFYLGVNMTATTAIVLAAAVSVFADQTALLFTNTDTDARSLDLISSLLVWTAPFFLLDAWQILFTYVLRGLRRTVGPMVLSTSCYWFIGIAGGVLISQSTAFQVAGIWIGFCLGLTSAATLLGVLAYREVRKHSPL